MWQASDKCMRAQDHLEALKVCLSCSRCTLSVPLQWTKFIPISSACCPIISLKNPLPECRLPIRCSQSMPTHSLWWEPPPIYDHLCHYSIHDAWSTKRVATCEAVRAWYHAGATQPEKLHSSRSGPWLSNFRFIAIGCLHAALAGTIIG